MMVNGQVYRGELTNSMRVLQVSPEVVLTEEAYIAVGEMVIKYKELKPTVTWWRTRYVQEGLGWLRGIFEYLHAQPLADLETAACLLIREGAGCLVVRFLSMPTRSLMTQGILYA
jgi:hypothetical protein